MSRKNDIVSAVTSLLAPLKKSEGGPASDVVVVDAKFAAFLSGRGGKFDLPLVGVAYAGSPQTASATTGRLLHRSVRVVAVFIVTRDAAGVEAEATRPTIGLHDLADAVEDLVAGAVPMVGDDVIGHPIECVGDEPVPLPAEAVAKNLVAWSVGLQFVQEWMPDRDAVTDPPEFTKIAGATAPGTDAVEPDADTTMDAGTGALGMEETF